MTGWDAFSARVQALIEELKGQAQNCRRIGFGPKSEKPDPAQLEPALEDLETAIDETQEQILANATDPQAQPVVVEYL